MEVPGLKESEPKKHRVGFKKCVEKHFRTNETAACWLEQEAYLESHQYFLGPNKSGAAQKFELRPRLWVVSRCAPEGLGIKFWLNEAIVEYKRGRKAIKESVRNDMVKAQERQVIANP